MMEGMKMAQEATAKNEDSGKKEGDEERRHRRTWKNDCFVAVKKRETILTAPPPFLLCILRGLTLWR